MSALKTVLLDKWYTQNRTDGDLASRIGCDKSLISKYVQGICEPPIHRKIQIAQALGMDSRLVFPIEGEK